MNWQTLLSQQAAQYIGIYANIITNLKILNLVMRGKVERFAMNEENNKKEEIINESVENAEEKAEEKAATTKTKARKRRTKSKTVKIKSTAALVIRDRFADPKYISHRVCNGYYYSIQVHKPKPEIRDALSFLTLNADYEGKEIPFPITGRGDERKRMISASDKLYAFACGRMGPLRVFFKRVRKATALGGGLLRPYMWMEEMSLEDVCRIIRGYDSVQIFATVVKAQHQHGQIQDAFIKAAFVSRENFDMFLQGVSIDPVTKADLLQIYEMCDLSGEGKPSLAEILCSFVVDYYNEYVKLYNTVSDFVQSFYERIVKLISKHGDLPGMTNCHQFYKLLFECSNEVSVCIKLNPFTRNNEAFHKTFTSILINLGSSATMKGRASAWNYFILGDNLKSFATKNITTVMNFLKGTTHSLDEIAKELKLSQSGTYLLMKRLCDENCVIKDSKTGLYEINKEHITKLCNLLEVYGGER